MPEPFRLFAPPPLKTEKVVLVQSHNLLLALPATIVREVLLAAPVENRGNQATTLYQDQKVPVILGQSICPAMWGVPLVLLKTDALKTGLLAIACSSLPTLAAVSDPEWIAAQPLPAPWQSDGKGYQKGKSLFARSAGLAW